MSFNDRLRERLQTMIINLGGAIPAIESPTDEESRTLALLDVLASRLLGGRFCVTFTAMTAAEMMNDSTPFFVADRNYRVVEIRCIYAYPNANPLTCTIQARPAAIQLAAFDCKQSPQTVLSVSLDFLLSAGNRLAIGFSAAATELRSFNLTVFLVPA